MNENFFKTVKQNDPTKPHKAMIVVYYSLHEKDNQNRANGNPIEYEHKEFYIDGDDKSICERKVFELLEMVGNVCSKEKQ